MRRADPAYALLVALTISPAAFAGDYALAAASVGSAATGSTSAAYALKPAVFGLASASSAAGDYALAGGFAAQTGFPETFLASAAGAPALALSALASGATPAVTPILLRVYGAQGTLTLTAPEGYQLSRQPDAGFAASLVVPPAELVPPGFTIYLRLAPGTPVGVVNGQIVVAGATAPTPAFSISGIITGPLAAADSVTKPTRGAQLKIPVSTLLANDRRLAADGTILSTGLAVLAVAPGAGNSAVLSSGRVLFTGNAASDTDTFTYTVGDGVSSATATVTVALASAAPFSLQLISVGVATFDGTNTSGAYGFIGVPNQTYSIQYTSDLSGEWTTLPPVSTGPTGSFSVTVIAAGDQAALWNSRIFFRAVRF